MKKFISIILFFIIGCLSLTGCSVVSSINVDVTEYTYGDKVFFQNTSITDVNAVTYKKYLMAVNEEYVIEFSSDSWFSGEISYDDVTFDYDVDVLKIERHPSSKTGKAIIKAIGVVKNTKVTLKLSNGTKGGFYVEVR